MKPAFLIFVVAALLVGSSSAEAARGTAAGNSNLILPATPPISSAPLTPQTNPIGGIGTGQSFGAGVTHPIGGVFTDQGFGALPGNPGSPTYDPNAALPSLGNEGSAAPGINTPNTSTGP